jgi:putative ABC transport system ATP-binding protein
LRQGSLGGREVQGPSTGRQAAEQVVAVPAPTTKDAPSRAGTGGEPVIELRDVSKRFTTPAGVVVALDSVSLSLRPGLVVVLGPSGSGKTTLLNLVGALDTPTSGEITVAGRRVTGLRRADLFAYRRHTVTFVFQAFNLFPELTAVENVRFGAEVAGRPGAAQDAARLLDEVGLADRLHHYPHELSGGEQQRVAIARSLATANPVLLADEPTGELDFHTGIQILGLLRARADTGQTVVVVTHNREIARVADVVVELSDGAIRQIGPPPGGPIPVETLRW